MSQQILLVADSTSCLHVSHFGWRISHLPTCEDSQGLVVIFFFLSYWLWWVWFQNSHTLVFGWQIVPSPLSWWCTCTQLSVLRNQCLFTAEPVSTALAWKAAWSNADRTNSSPSSSCSRLRCKKGQNYSQALLTPPGQFLNSSVSLPSALATTSSVWITPNTCHLCSCQVLF